jgi:hypothetical protein
VSTTCGSSLELLEYFLWGTGGGTTSKG